MNALKSKEDTGRNTGEAEGLSSKTYEEKKKLLILPQTVSGAGHIQTHASTAMVLYMTEKVKEISRNNCFFKLDKDIKDRTESHGI